MTTINAMSRRISAALVALVSTLAVIAGVLVQAGPAAAATGRNGICETGEFCYFFNSNEAGSLSDFSGSLDDYGDSQPTCYEFKSSGNGQGYCIKNHAASVRNLTDKTVRVYFNSNYAGAYQDFKPNAEGNLNATLKNNDASHQFLGPGGSTGGCHTDGTNSKMPSSILVYRVSEGTVQRVDFKDYVKNVLPNEWQSSWDTASLQAGAIAVKSFGWFWALHSVSKTSSGQCYDVTDTTASQVYRPGSAVGSTSDAVDSTWDVRMTRSGNVLQAHYCSTTTACGNYVAGDWMSQYGSQDLAKAGNGWPDILHHYYSGISLQGGTPQA